MIIDTNTNEWNDSKYILDLEYMYIYLIIITLDIFNYKLNGMNIVASVPLIFKKKQTFATSTCHNSVFSYKPACCMGALFLGKKQNSNDN